jgi:hypothetical protein
MEANGIHCEIEGTCLGHLQMPGYDRVQEYEQQNAEEPEQFTAHFVVVVEGKEGLTAQQVPVVELASGPVQATASSSSL